jgi:hypothetical protein
MSRLALFGNNQLLEMLKNPEIALADPPKITRFTIENYLRNKFNPNMEYQGGKRVITQSIYNLSLAQGQGRPNIVQENCFEVIGTLIKGGAILSDTDEANLTKLVPDWKNRLGYSSNKTNVMISNDIITNNIRDGQYLESGSVRDFFQYMGPKGGRRRSSRRKVKRSSSRKRGSSVKRGGRNLSRKRSSSRRLKGG